MSNAFSPSTPAAVTGALLEAAADGDEEAFAQLTEPFRRELHRHCYRLLGSVTDADDLLQETMLAAWRGLGGFCGDASVRTWLYRIATNRCLNAIRNGRRRPPSAPVPPFEPPEPTRRWETTWLQPYPDAWIDPTPSPPARSESRESVRLAFVAALQALPPRQGAALVLCDVLDFSLTEVAEMLATSRTAAKGLVQRARVALRRHEALGPNAGFEEGSAAEAALAQRFADAFCADDVDAVVALLTDEAWLAMPPAPHVYVGTHAVGAFLHASARGRAGKRLVLHSTRANRQPAFSCFLEGPNDEALRPSGAVVLTVAGGRIEGVTRFLDPRLPAIFDRAGSGAAPGLW